MTHNLPSMPHAIRRPGRLLAKTSRIAAVALPAVALPAVALVGVAFPAFASGDLVLIPEIEKLATLLITFTILIFPVNALVFKPIMRALEEREARIAGARERSNYLQREADSVLERYETSIRDARADAERSRKVQLDGAKSEQMEITSAARAEAERQLDRARNELRASLESARSNLRGQAEELAREAAASVLGRAL